MTTRQVQIIIVVTFLCLMMISAVAAIRIGSEQRCNCTVDWEGYQIPIEDAIEQIHEGLQEVNANISCEGR